jgi:thioredoxin-dependent peroxiredoxin
MKTGLQSLAATAAAVFGALMSAAGGRGGSGPIELEVGDEAPDFTLPGSDGRSYHLRDYRGKRVVVVAWFPKAFTGG